MKRRLNLVDRRKQIVGAAIPLFARKGFAGTTSREIAEAANVSEALVFRHFANKAVLYDAIIQQFTDTTPAFVQLCTLQPSTRTLVRVVREATEYFMTVTADEEGRARCRLFLRSISEDTSFTHSGVDAYAELRSVFERSFEAARAAGDIDADAPNATVAFWLIMRQHIMLPAWTILPDHDVAKVPIDDYVDFILRGIGLKREVARRLRHETEADGRDATADRRMAASSD
jgi:AcrR family transcriptional regulator